jgi:hypothetical protein
MARPEKYDAGEANKLRTTRLQHNDLRRRARRFGLELRHSDYGYSLIDGDRRRVDDRNDLTLDEVAKHLKTRS